MNKLRGITMIAIFSIAACCFGQCGTSGGCPGCPSFESCMANDVVIPAAPTIEVKTTAIVKKPVSGYGLFGVKCNAVKTGTGPIALVYWGAKWCQPCKKMKPLMQQLANEGYRVQIGDIDEYSDIAETWNIGTVPTFLLNQDGKELWRHEGTLSDQFLRNIIRDFKIKKVRAPIQSAPAYETYSSSTYVPGACNCAMSQAIRAGTWRGGRAGRYR